MYCVMSEPSGAIEMVNEHDVKLAADEQQWSIGVARVQEWAV